MEINRVYLSLLLFHHVEIENLFKPVLRTNNGNKKSFENKTYTKLHIVASLFSNYLSTLTRREYGNRLK